MIEVMSKSKYPPKPKLLSLEVPILEDNNDRKKIKIKSFFFF